MEIEIGNQKYETEQAFGTTGFAIYRLKAPQLLGMVPQAVYFWDCLLEPGGNPKRPRVFIAEHNFCTKRITRTGRIHDAQTRAQETALLKRTGLKDMDAMNAAIALKFPPLMVPIPWPQLETFMTKRNSVRVIAWVAYVHRVVKPKGAGRERYILSIPVAVQFQAIPIWMCNIRLILMPPADREAGVFIPAPKEGPSREFRDEEKRDSDAYREAQPEGARELDEAARREGRQRRDKYKRKLRQDLEEQLDELDDW